MSYFRHATPVGCDQPENGPLPEQDRQSDQQTTSWCTLVALCIHFEKKNSTVEFKYTPMIACFLAKDAIFDLFTQLFQIIVFKVHWLYNDYGTFNVVLVYCNATHFSVDISTRPDCSRESYSKTVLWLDDFFFFELRNAPTVIFVLQFARISSDVLMHRLHHKHALPADISTIGITDSYYSIIYNIAGCARFFSPAYARSSARGYQLPGRGIIPSYVWWLFMFFVMYSPQLWADI